MIAAVFCSLCEIGSWIQRETSQLLNHRKHFWDLLFDCSYWCNAGSSKSNYTIGALDDEVVERGGYFYWTKCHMRFSPVKVNMRTHLPSGDLTYGKSPFLKANIPISMAIVINREYIHFCLHPWSGPLVTPHEGLLRSPSALVLLGSRESRWRSHWCEECTDFMGFYGTYYLVIKHGWLEAMDHTLEEPWT